MSTSVLERYQTSYAQNREDIILSVFFSKVKNGFYVDVGAADPVIDSATRYFYERGWHGINIEPNPLHFTDLDRDRTHDVNLKIGIGDKRGTSKLRIYSGGNHGLSTLSQEMQQAYETSSEGPKAFEDITIDVLTLTEVLDTHVKPGQDIHFLKIDVEGFEKHVLVGNDWKKYRPWVICIESNHIVDEWEKYLLDQDYELATSDGLNKYFVSKEHADLIKHFNDEYAPQVLLGKPFIGVRAARDIASLEEQSLRLLHEKSTSNDISSTIERLLGAQFANDPVMLGRKLGELLEQKAQGEPGVINALQLLDGSIQRYFKKLRRHAKVRQYKPNTQTYNVAIESPAALLAEAKQRDYSDFNTRKFYKRWVVIFTCIRLAESGYLFVRKVAFVIGRKLKRGLSA